MIPGELWTPDGEIEINVGRALIELRVSNSGDRPIQVGSHYHFYETNDALLFDRSAARGFRLNIPAGTAVRFEPGQSRDVELVKLAGLRKVYGFAGRIMGSLDERISAKDKKVAAKPAPAKKKPATKVAALKVAASTVASSKVAGSKVAAKKSARSAR